MKDREWIRWTVWLVCGVLFSGLVGTAGELVLSEIAWAGTAASASDEWIEIHNRGEADVDLIGWEVRFANVRILLGEVGESTTEARTSILPAGAFLLLERTDDTTVVDIEADVIYKGLLSNAGVRMELVDPSGVVVDWVDPGEDGWLGGGSAGHDIPYCTMERTEDGGWVSNNGMVRNGLDADGHPINGTPKRMNSADVIARRAPAVRLLRPDDEGITLSGVVILSWAATDPDGADAALSICLSVSADNGGTWEDLVANLVNTGSYSWDTRALAAGDQYRLRVTATDPDGFSTSVVGARFTLASP